MGKIGEMAMEAYEDRKVVLGRGNTCLSCGRVQREAYAAGADAALEMVLAECRRMAGQAKEHVDNPVDRTDGIGAYGCLSAMEDVIRFIKKLRE